jgi:hypothetical protein
MSAACVLCLARDTGVQLEDKRISHEIVAYATLYLVRTLGLAAVERDLCSYHRTIVNDGHLALAVRLGALVAQSGRA